MGGTMAKMRAVQVPSAKGPLQMVEREIPEPVPGWVRIRVEACGICHADSYVKEGLWPGIQYPRVPGHEVAGVIDAVGSGVGGWKPGQRVGVGWFGGSCGYCENCRRGEFLFCSVERRVTAITQDGGYADYMVTPAAAVALIPEELSAAEAGPLFCAGVTTFNSLRNSGARPGDLVAILGIGGLGHLGVQFASKMGFRTVAIARGKDKAALAKELGAKIYIDSEAQNPAEELTKLGGARVILATVTSGKAMNATVGGLGLNGKMIVVGAADEPIQVPAYLLIGGRKSVTGWPSGTSIGSQPTPRFRAQTGGRPRNEIFPLDRAAEAYQRIITGKAGVRVVLPM